MKFEISFTQEEMMVMKKLKNVIENCGGDCIMHYDKDIFQVKQGVDFNNAYPYKLVGKVNEIYTTKILKATSSVVPILASQIKAAASFIESFCCSMNMVEDKFKETDKEIKKEIVKANRNVKMAA